MARYYPDHVTPVPRPGEGSRGHRIRQWLKRAVAEEWYGYDGARAPRPARRRLLRRIIGWPFRGLLRQVPRYRRNGRVLDIGCGSGGYLAFLAEMGWHCAGVETGAKSRAYAQTVLGLDVREGPLEACGFPDAAFDVVTLWHVIEHLPDPRATLREIGRILKPEGLLLLRTPNVESWEAALFRGNWYGLDAPRHLYLFSPATMERLLRQCGFAVTAVRATYHAVDCSRSLLYRCRDMTAAWPALLVARTIGAIELVLNLFMPLRRLCGRGGAVHIESQKVAHEP
jgi:SAM-dependent methyltransferase